MPLEFRPAAIVVPDRGVRFAGYPTGHQADTPIICDVGSEVLEHLGAPAVADSHLLLEIFERHRPIIMKIVSEQFDNGHRRPRVTLEHFGKTSQGREARRMKPQRRGKGSVPMDTKTAAHADAGINIAAQSLIRTHGDGAVMEAARMADKWAKRDPEAGELWRRVMLAIRRQSAGLPS